jgi:prepilin-type processing-associated H-X9-DG protein
LLFQYAPGVGVYHCPGDLRFNLPIGRGNSVGWAYDSYAVTQNVVPSGSSPASFSKTSQIHRTSDCFVFVEQSDTRGYNNGPFVVGINPGRLITVTFDDVFATYHGSIGTFAFADGHAEPKKWTDPVILAAGLATVRTGSSVFYYSGQYMPDSIGHDAPWLIQHCVAPNNP